MFQSYLCEFSSPLVGPSLTYSANREAGSLPLTISSGEAGFYLKAFDGRRRCCRCVTLLWRRATCILLNLSRHYLWNVSFSTLLLGAPVHFDPSTMTNIISAAEIFSRSLTETSFVNAASWDKPLILGIGTIDGAIHRNTLTILCTPVMNLLQKACFSKFLNVFKDMNGEQRTSIGGSLCYPLYCFTSVVLLPE